jgi:hypothetical protein
MYPAYGYPTPAPPYPQQSRSGNPLALVLLGLIALAGIAVGALAAAGVFSRSSATHTITSPTLAHSPTKTPAATLPRTTATGPPTQPAAPGPSNTSGLTSCGVGIWAGPNTSCGFAQNVEQAYDQTTGGNQVVIANSPATGQTYTIDCTGNTPHFCTGGTTNDASIYFTSVASATPSPTQPASPSPSPAPTGVHACDQNVSAAANTSCQFAENVFYEYTQSPQNQSGQTMTVYSPVTHNDYSVRCTPDGQGNIGCLSNTGSYTSFSQQAVQNYTPTQAAAYAAAADLGNSNPNG